MPLDANPFNSWATVIDCGDIPVTSYGRFTERVPSICILKHSRYDNAYALQQIEEGHHSILSREPATASQERGPSLKSKTLPRVITLGGDHTITLPLLRSVNRAYGPITVIHFDSHLYDVPV